MIRSQATLRHELAREFPRSRPGFTGEECALVLQDRCPRRPESRGPAGSEAGPGEVRVRIHRSGINPTAGKIRRGAEPDTPVEPQVPNQDGAGVIDAVGEGVESALHGLRVWVWGTAAGRPSGGTAQEYAVVPARSVVLLPDSASFDLGASLGVPFLTAHRCLTVTEDGPARPRDTAGPLGPRRRWRRRRWQRHHSAGPLVQRHRDHHGRQPGEATLAGHAGANHVINYKRAAVENGTVGKVLIDVTD